ncbi:MAG: CTP synthase [Cenarchaeum symbiont of Oopsacas minuta]|nr:CTP synthase [Cenarchaeum symbiont of Oopsacas minuta]
MQTTKYIFVTGGVMSGLGKGVISSSIAKLLQLANQRVSCVKIDPYLNYDAGTMNPVAHGEVYVTKDGGECDMDLGNYERFLNQDIPKSHNITTAQIYSKVIERERRGEYLGACVQIIPHITDQIKEMLRSISADERLDMLVIECGGTVGDIESLPFLEALRQMRVEEGPSNVAFVHVTLAPSLDVVGEQKTKPTQHSVQELRRIGIQPDYLAVRCTSKLEEKTRQKLALFTNVSPSNVLSSHDALSIYSIPDILHQQGVVDSLFKKFGITGIVDGSTSWNAWRKTVQDLSEYGQTVRIAMVGKYVTLPDSYVSVIEALKHAGAVCNLGVDVKLLDSETLPKDLGSYDGILVPGGFGDRGSDGIIRAASYAAKNNVPYLGICFGFQLAAVALARQVCGVHDANSIEIEQKCAHPVVDILPEQKNVTDMGGSLRLGANEIRIEQGTLAHKMYDADTISKRHRHRYEINPKYLDVFAKGGVVFSASSDSRRRMEILEYPSNEFFIGVQYHPEFDSRPGLPENVFSAFLTASTQT